MAKFPVGPRNEEPVAWNEIWGWAIPASVPEERKALAKEMLGGMLTDIDGQVAQWEETGGPPPNQEAWEVLAEKDPVFAKLKEVVFDVNIPTHSAYYFPNWPAVHKAYSDTVIAAVTGSREDIPQVLDRGVQTIHNAAAQ
jgi:multiple sugar transport system substrate-binding protein